MKLTHRILENLTCPEGQKDRLVADDDQTGLYIRIGAKACKGSLTHKNFLAKAGRTRIPLGRCTAISLAQAREAARSIMGDIAKGLNPLAGREVATAARQSAPELTFGQLISDWEALQLVNRRLKYRTEAVRALRASFKAHLSVPANGDHMRPIAIKVRDAIARRPHG